MYRKLTATVIALIAVITSSAASAQVDDYISLDVPGKQPIQLLRIAHADANIEIDGRLDEPVWTELDTIGELRVTDPDTLAVAPYPTNTRIFYTDKGIYVSFDMVQPVDTIIERAAPRDAYGVNRDNVGFTLDTSGDGRYGYWMNLSLGDSEMDGTILPERQYGIDWDGAWYGATQRTDKGWAAEFYIPWSQMAMPKTAGERRIGIFVSRQVAFLDERWGWPGLTQTQPRFLSAMQPLTVSEVDPRQQWSLFPYASATMDNVDDDNVWKTGMDVFWRPSTNFQLTATVNPDFGSVESDNVVVNLTANETFFPEKRLFFQEGQGIFDVSGAKEQFGQPGMRMVNTRRIGGRPRELDLPNGVDLARRQTLEPADIIAAAKATGQIGAVRYGFLAASENDKDYTASDDLLYTMAGRDFGIMRIIYEDSRNAAYRGLGFISTLVAHPESDAIVHGMDAHYLSSSGTWNLNGQYIYSDIDEIGDGSGLIAEANYQPRKGLRHEIKVSLLDDKVDVNDLGFQVRNDMDDFIYRIQWNKSGLQKVRNFRLSPFARYQVNGEGFRTFHGYGVGGQVNLNSLHTIGGFIGYFPDQYDDRNSFDNGTFAVRGRTYADLNFRSNTAKALSIFLRVGLRPEAMYGDSLESQIGLTWRPLDNLSMELNVLQIDKNGWLLHQDDENFTTFNGTQWQPQFSLEFYPTSKQQLRLSMQWVGIKAFEDRFYELPDGTTELIEIADPTLDSDDFSISQLNFQVRYRWQIAPLSDLFVVYTKGDRQKTDLMGFSDLFDDNWSNPLGDFLIVKLRYRLGS
ncbi:MAG: DUF5916 domain-containing protein [Woeseiaceae bacterium]|nr:DUF5916 domain-containing protein [Woeseiaceae bacterium]